MNAHKQHNTMIMQFALGIGVLFICTAAVMYVIQWRSAKELLKEPENVISAYNLFEDADKRDYARLEEMHQELVMAEMNDPHFLDKLMTEDLYEQSKKDDGDKGDIIVTGNQSPWLKISPGVVGQVTAPDPSNPGAYEWTDGYAKLPDGAKEGDTLLLGKDNVLEFVPAPESILLPNIDNEGLPTK